MTPPRSLSLSDLPKRRKGECRWCGKPVTGRRRTWCSQECVREYQVRANPGIVRYLVYQRDLGVCALCGLDTAALEETVRRYRKALIRHRRRRGESGSWLEGLTVPVPKHGRKWVDLGRTLWQADHIVPVAEGGGACDLGNYRTLCVWCHPKETGKLRRRLNAKRRDQDRPLLVVSG